MTDFLMLRFDLSLIDAVFLYGILWAIVVGLVVVIGVSLTVGMQVTFGSMMARKRREADWSGIDEELKRMARGEVVR